MKNGRIFQIPVFWIAILHTSFTFLSILFQHPAFLSCNLPDVIGKRWRNVQIDADLESENVLERRFSYHRPVPMCTVYMLRSAARSFLFLAVLIVVPRFLGLHQSVNC